LAFHGVVTFVKENKLTSSITIKIIHNGSVSLCAIFKVGMGGVRGCAAKRV
jgi:hypothetical protein